MIFLDIKMSLTSDIARVLSFEFKVLLLFSIVKKICNKQANDQSVFYRTSSFIAYAAHEIC